MLEARSIVTRDNLIEAERVLTAPEYWSPPDEPNSTWLVEDVLPRVRTFLQTHQSHTLRFGEFEDLAGPAELAFIDWLDLSVDPDLGPRYFIEALKIPRWADAIDWVRASKHPPWWWSEGASLISSTPYADDLRKPQAKFTSRRRWMPLSKSLKANGRASS